MKTDIVNNYTICEKNMVSEGEEEPTKMPKKIQDYETKHWFSKFEIINYRIFMTSQSKQKATVLCRSLDKFTNADL